MKKIFLPILILLVLSSIVNASIPIINSYLNDNAGVVSANAKLQLEQELRDLEKATNGVQYVIFIENEYPKEYSLEEYTLKIAETNKVGKKGNDNGVLLYVAVKDRKYRWETGYGVESMLSSALLGRISREYLAPNFRNGDYEKGILQAFDVTKRILLGSNDEDIVRLKNQEMVILKSHFSYLSITIFGIALALISIISIVRSAKNQKNFKKGKKYKDNFYHGAAWGLFAGGFGRGGSGGSGGFGGFSGGGGGFGGGGGGGSW